MDFVQIELALRQSPLFQELFEVIESGDSGRFESEAKRQHFIPQFLLRDFAADADREWIFQLDTATGANRKVRISEAASRRYFYAIVNEEGERNNQIEGFLAFVEGHAAPALERLLTDPENLSEADRGTLSFFFALLDQRTPGATSRSGQVQDAVMRMLFASEFSNEDEFAERYRRMEAEHGDERASDEEIEKFRLELIDDLRAGRVGFANLHAQALQMALKIAGEQCYLIYGLRWTILRCPGGFITSDRGLAIHDPAPQYPWSSQGLLSSEGAETTIPLSADMCLLLTLEEQGTVVRDVSAAEAETINLRTYGWADGYVFGASQERVTELRRTAKRRPGDVVRPKPTHHVLLMDADPRDTSLAQRNQARGWPAYIPVDGVPHDYLVIRHDQNPVEAMALSSEKTRERARRALGLGQGEQLEGREEVVTMSLDRVGHGGGTSGAIQRDWSEFKAWTEEQMKRQEADGS